MRLARAQRGVVRGFKIWLGYRRVFARDEVFDPLYDYAEEHRLPVLFHTGDTASSAGSLVHAHPLTLDEVANEREGLKMVVCHMGNPWIADTAELLYKHSNVFADISGLVVGAGATRGSTRACSPRGSARRSTSQAAQRGSSSGRTTPSRPKRTASRSSPC